MVFSTTFNTFFPHLYRVVNLLVEETRLPGENH